MIGFDNLRLKPHKEFTKRKHSQPVLKNIFDRKSPEPFVIKIDIKIGNQIKRYSTSYFSGTAGLKSEVSHLSEWPKQNHPKCGWEHKATTIL